MLNRIGQTAFAAGLLWAACLTVPAVGGDEPAGGPPTAKPIAPSQRDPEPKSAADATGKNDKNIVFLTEDRDVWVNKQHKQIVMKGKITIREGNLEMFV